MSKKTKQILGHSRGRNIGFQSAKGASIDVLSVPGGTQTDSELTDKHREDANVEVSPQGALPVISVPGGS
jgi:hypothetical protein